MFGGGGGDKATSEQSDQVAAHPAERMVLLLVAFLYIYI